MYLLAMWVVVMQIGEVIVWATLQCSAKGLARVLK